MVAFPCRDMFEIEPRRHPNDAQATSQIQSLPPSPSEFHHPKRTVSPCGAVSIDCHSEERTRAVKPAPVGPLEVGAWEVMIGGLRRRHTAPTGLQLHLVRLGHIRAGLFLLRHRTVQTTVAESIAPIHSLLLFRGSRSSRYLFGFGCKQCLNSNACDTADLLCILIFQMAREAIAKAADARTVTPDTPRQFRAGQILFRHSDV